MIIKCNIFFKAFALVKIILIYGEWMPTKFLARLRNTKQGLAIKNTNGYESIRETVLLYAFIIAIMKNG